MTTHSTPPAAGGARPLAIDEDRSAPAAQRSMRIGELATRIGINPKTIRYYERIGLLPEPRRRPSGYRTYDAEDLERLAFIRRAQQLGLRLHVIGEILALRDQGDRPCGYVLDAVRHELRDLDSRISALHRVRAQLTALVAHAESLDGASGRYCALLEHQDAR